jgi:hypothetical protein
VIESAADYLQSHQRTLKDAKKDAEDANKVMVDVSEIFAETDRLFEETEVGIAYDIGLSKQPGGKTPTEVLAAEVEFSNRRYEKQLDEVKKILKNRQSILEKKEDGWQQALATNLIDFDRAQGKALVYAQEAYYSAGPVIHVVKGMQAGGEVVLTPNQKLQSILMNIGYKLQHYEHIRNERGKYREEQAKMGTAKYGQRVGHEAVWQQEGNELRDVAAVQELLTHERHLVALKKGKATEQREKVAIAQQIEPPSLAMDKFVAIAMQAITPYLVAHYRHPAS